MLRSPLCAKPSDRLASTSLSSSMTGGGQAGQLPPGLRFPSGFQLGHHLVIFGTFLSQHVNHFAIWALNLGSAPTSTSRGALGGGGGANKSSLEWTRVDPGSVLQKGSWNRAVGWKNNVVVLGDRGEKFLFRSLSIRISRSSGIKAHWCAPMPSCPHDDPDCRFQERDIAADYDHRQVSFPLPSPLVSREVEVLISRFIQTNFTHVAFVDLEAHGIYQPPSRPLPPIAQRFGLATLAQPFLSDFEIVCSDGKRIACSRRVLEDRWSWFGAKVLEFRGRASGVVAAQHKRATNANDSVGVVVSSSSSLFNNSEEGGAGSSSLKSSSATDHAAGGGGPSAASATSEMSTARSTTTTTVESTEARLTPRTLDLPEPSPVVVAFVEYLYTLALSTRLQLDVSVLGALLTFSKTYRDDQLRALVVHALHETLSADPTAAPSVYEAATLGACTALQVRALKVLMAAPNAHHTARTPSSVRSGGGGGGGGRGSLEQQQQMTSVAAEPMARQASQGKPLVFA